ncbi:MAG: type II toxin-antitoxin system RelE/ParE family toxin, partial [Solobacterium sp.]|nr:type II toxin-antitoxin system RelE/ParE family toxin [Solobacterium sp.]
FKYSFRYYFILGIVSLIKSLEYLPERYPRFELLKKETNVRYAIYKKYKIIYEIMDDKVYILRVIHHSQNITNNFFLAENEIPYVVESD